MILKPTLKSLSAKYLLDAKVLLLNKRYSSSIYIAGYAVELALKFKICETMVFKLGFPENKAEFNYYFSDTRKVLLRATIQELREIRNHDLKKLLRYSGEQYNLETNFVAEWNKVKDWNPEMRYENNIIRQSRANDFLNSAKTIINQIL